MIQNKPLFSLLIANYNNSAYLPEAIESVREQIYTNWEIVIIDDCSTDNPHELYKLLEEDKRIKVFFNSENKGCGFTKRRCVEEASGEICGFLDPDDKLPADALLTMMNRHIDAPNIGLIHSKAYHCDENMKILNRIAPSMQVRKQGDKMFFNLEASISHFATFKKEFYNKTDGINPYLKRAVDQDLYLKLYDVGKTLFLDQFLYYYRIHKSGISTNHNIEKAIYWHWVVINDTAKRRDINVEELFINSFVRKELFDSTKNKYMRLKKYEKINNFLASIRKCITKLINPS